MKISSGLLMCKFKQGELLFLIAHPGGPFWENNHTNSWSIPKGEILENEDPFDAAVREFQEETNIEVDLNKEFWYLKTITQKSGKIVHAWCFLDEYDDSIKVISNTCHIEYPRKSGKILETPEVDELKWMNMKEAEEKINKSQFDFLTRAKQIFERK